MRVIIISLSLIFTSLVSIGQNLYLAQDQFRVFPIDNLSATDTNFADLQFLKDKLKEKRIVMLGEQSHGDAASFEAKVKLIKFLHQEMGFELLCFESGLFDNYFAYNSIQDQDYFNSPIKESVFQFWSQTKEFKPLIQYIHQQKMLNKPLILAGFDCQEDFYFKENYFNTLKQRLSNTWKLTENEESILEQTFSSDGEDLHDNPLDSALFFKACSKILLGMEQDNKPEQLQLSILKQTLISWLGYINYMLDEQNSKLDTIQNRRDQIMANNLLALSKIYPNKKIICWGASYHFANKIEQAKFTPLSLEKLTNMGDGDTIGQDVDHYYRDAVPMGKILKKELGDSIYSIAFSSYEGKFGMLGGEEFDFSQVQAPNKSLEKELVDHNIPIALVDFQHATKRIAPFYLSALGNIPLMAEWQNIFDAVVFIKTTNKPQLDEQVNDNLYTLDSVTDHKDVQLANYKTIIDCKSKKGLYYAQARLLNNQHTVTTNNKGQFNLDVSSCVSTDKIILSNMGYISDTISVRDYLTKNVFLLKPSIQHLHEIKIRANKLSAREIVIRAEQAVRTNYMQEPYRQNFIYQYTSLSEDTMHFKKEISLSILNNQGISSGKVPKTTLTKLKERVQRLTSKKNNGWGEYDINEKLFNSNVITLKNNPLHRSKYYTYTNLGIVPFEDRQVYEISFECIKPTNTAIGMGRKPLASTGFMYIDVENFSLLKFVQEISCSPTKHKENSDIIMSSHVHHLVQTYYAHQGKYYPSNYSNIQIHQTTNQTTQKTTRGILSTEYSSLGIFSPTDTSMYKQMNDQDFESQCKSLSANNTATLYQILEKLLSQIKQSITK